jgi:Mn2+/Fe2+ NRAMP family transporter
VWRGGYRLFGQLMRICIGLMFFTVITTAALLWPGWEEVARGLLVPRLPSGEGLIWTVALIGGVGGTLTVLSYGYWIREEGRHSQADLRACRIDLACGYAMTAIFGICMIIIGSTITVHGEGTGLLISLSDRLGERWGPAGKWLFLIGTFGTVYSSLLGVWQAVPYLFADCWRLLRGRERVGARETVSTDAKPYRVYLVLIALVPMLGLLVSFREVQKIYAVIGALFFPLLALALLVFNGRTAWVGRQFRNRPLTVVALLGVLALFAWIAIAGIKLT